MTSEIERTFHLPPRPCKEDVLFGPDSRVWRMDARLDFGLGNDYAYREGYRRAGRILTDWVEVHGEQDFLVFPICHAYRHFVELTLKLLIVDCFAVVDRPPSQHESNLLHKHNLKALWEAFKSVAAEVEKDGAGESPSPQDLVGLDSYVDQLHTVDSGSFAFQYQLTKGGTVSTGNITTINLGQFCTHMESMCIYLSGYEGYYQHLIELRDEALGDGESDLDDGSC